MAQEEAIKLFDEKQVRYVWDDEQEKYYFSVVDVIQVLTDSENPRKYWSVLKTRLKQEGSELATNCSQLKLQATTCLQKRLRSSTSRRKVTRIDGLMMHALFSLLDAQNLQNRGRMV